MTSEIIKTANLSQADGGLYRYRLTRIWDSKNARRVVFVMLNPSTADADVDDPTIRKCMGFARQWNQQLRPGICGQQVREEIQFGGISVVNLFAWRATDPDDLLASPDPIGPDNDDYIRREAFTARAAGSIVVCAWGANRAAELVDPLPVSIPRFVTVSDILRKHGPENGILRIGPLTKDDRPRHPLYLPYSSTLEPL